MPVLDRLGRCGPQDSAEPVPSYSYQQFPGPGRVFAVLRCAVLSCAVMLCYAVMLCLCRDTLFCT